MGHTIRDLERATRKLFADAAKKEEVMQLTYFRIQGNGGPCCDLLGKWLRGTMRLGDAARMKLANALVKMDYLPKKEN